MAWDHNYARIPDEENTDGGWGRKSDHSYARILDEENTELLYLPLNYQSHLDVGLRFLFILCDGFLYDLFCVSFVINLFKKSCLFQKKTSTR